MSELHDFGRFAIRFDQRQLLVDGHVAALGSRAFDVLRALVERRERVVGKEELLELVWPGLIVEENNLQVQISTLRKLLGAQAIATIPGRGYQFTAPQAAPAAAAAGPRSAAAGAAAAAPGMTEMTPITHPVRTSPAGTSPRGHLLVADDNKVNRLLLTRTLDLLGHQVASVDNGRKALDLLRLQRHDLLLLDLEMPELDGFAVLEELARDPELHDLPVIVTSSVEGVDKVARCIELGADDYLRKPVNPVLLKARVGSSLEKRRLREQQKALVQRLSAAAATPPVRFASPVPAVATAATVLSVGLRDGAAVTADDSPEQRVGLLDSCHTLWRDAVASHGGVIFDVRSEALMACFGTPWGRAAPAGDAEGLQPPPTLAEARLAAARAALEMAEMMDVFNAERTLSGLPALTLRVGLASGEVVVGEVAATPHTRCVCLGAPVRLAQALQALDVPVQGDGAKGGLGGGQRASPGDAGADAGIGAGHRIWLDAATQSALRGRVATEALPALPTLSALQHLSAPYATGAAAPAATFFRAVAN